MCKRCRKATTANGGWYCAECKQIAEAQVARMKKLDAIDAQLTRKVAAGTPRVGYGTTWRYQRARCKPKDAEGGARVTKELMLGAYPRG